jgi:hypothetical protein
MGQQQLLLLVLGIVIVGIAIVIGVRIYEAQIYESEIDNLSNELTSVITMAMTYAKKPTSMGGGGGTILGWNPPHFVDGEVDNYLPGGGGNNLDHYVNIWTTRAQYYFDMYDTQNGQFIYFGAVSIMYPLYNESGDYNDRILYINGWLALRDHQAQNPDNSFVHGLYMQVIRTREEFVAAGL